MNHKSWKTGLTRLESEASRLAPEQPLEFTEHTIHHQAKRLHYNLRKLSELPFHLVKSRRITDLKQFVVFNYEWLYTKLQAMSLHDIISDFRLALDSGFNDKEIELLANTLRISGSHLKETPHALAYELTGRLLPYYDDYRDVRILLQQCDTRALRHTCFVPLMQCFEAPRGMLTYILEDHKEIVLDLLFSKSSHELVSISRDSTIAFWDMRTGDRTRMIDVSDLHSGTNTRLHQSENGRYLVCDSDAINSPAYIFDLKSGQLIHKVGRRLTTQRRCFVVGNLLLRQKTIIDIVRGEEVATIDDFIPTKKYLTCGITPNQKYIVLGDSRETSVFNIRTRKLLVSFPGQHLPCLFTFTPDSALCYVGYNEDCLFKIFDIHPQSRSFGRTRLIFNYLNAYPELQHMDSPIYSNELSSISLSPRDDTMVLISIKRCQLILLNVAKQTSQKLDMTPVNQTGEKGAFLTHARLSGDGKFIVAAAGTYMHIWCAEKVAYITGVNIHSIERFPISVSLQRNLIATASTLHTAIKTWDLDKIYNAKDTQLKVYTNPIDTLAVSHPQRLMFVKKYHRQNYKYMDYFGLDVWNISTGTMMTCLATGQYGELLKMRVSHDGHQMALLITTRDQSYVCALSLKLNRVLTFHRHPGCRDFALSTNCDFIATEAKDSSGSCEVKLWCFKGGELARFDDASSPVFTSDDEYLLYAEGGKSIEVFCLKTMQGIISMLCDVARLDTVPTLSRYVLATQFPPPPPTPPTPPQEGETANPANSAPTQTVAPPPPLLEAFSQVSLWHINAGFLISQFQHVAPSGMRDFSKDGRLCIDGYLQVFDIKSGKRLTQLKCRKSANREPSRSRKNSTNEPAIRAKSAKNEFNLVKLTYDGQYAIWAQDLSINVVRISDNTAVGQICTHEKPVTLETLDFGYIVVVGREDGHILTAKLIDGENTLPQRFRPQTTKERLNTIMDKVIYPDGLIATFESCHQTRPKAIHDTSLPKFTKEVQNALQEKARVPHAVIKTFKKTSSFGDLKEFDKEFKKRRGSSPAIHLLEGGVNIGNGHRTAPCRLKKSGKSPSLTSLFSNNTTGRRKSRESSPSVHEVFSPQKGLHTSSLLVALTDFSGGVGKIFKRKSSESSSLTSSPMPARKLNHSPLSCPHPSLATPEAKHSAKLFSTQTSSPVAASQRSPRCSSPLSKSGSRDSPKNSTKDDKRKKKAASSLGIMEGAKVLTTSSHIVSTKPPKMPSGRMSADVTHHRKPLVTSSSADEVLSSHTSMTSPQHGGGTTLDRKEARSRFFSAVDAPPPVIKVDEPEVEITRL